MNNKTIIFSLFIFLLVFHGVTAQIFWCQIKININNTTKWCHLYDKL